jgi:hypothetical protein
MQMICALLVFGTPTFDRDMGELSPWLELVMHRSAVRPRVSYLCVGRDPRDVGTSWGNHLVNMDLHAVRQARDAVDLATADNLLPSVPPAEATSRRERFRHWMLDATPVADSGSSLRFTLHHLATIWDMRDSSNVILVHYDDLKADLPGEMRRLARRLDITVPESAWPSLERAATFDDMREHASRLVTDSGLAKRDKTQFFNRGASGQWTGVLEDADLRE